MKPGTLRERRPSRVAGSLRVLLYFGVVFGTFTYFGVRAAMAHTEEALFSFGRNLASLEALTDRPHRVRINGQLMNVQHTTVPEPLDEVIERVREHCDVGGPFLDPLFPGFEALASPTDTAMMTRQKANEAIAACFVRPSGMPSTIAERLERFSSSLDVSTFGLFRYVFAREIAPGKTSVLTMWLSEPFRVDALIGSGGEDAPGSDPLDAPRPADSTRLLTIQIEDSPYATYIYRSREDPGPLAGDFERRAHRMGWKGSNSLSRVKGDDGGAYLKKGLLLFVNFSRTDDGTVIAMTASSVER